MSKVAAVVVAAGRGKRMGAELAKQYLPLAGRPVLVHTLEVFERCAAVDEVVLVVRKEDVAKVREEIIEPYGLSKVKHVVGGGHERQNSVFNGLKALLPQGALVVVHDGVRPLFTAEKLLQVLEAGRESGAAILAVPVKETVKQVNKESLVVERTLPRETLWLAQTPQVFHWEVLWPAMQKAMVCGFSATDEAGIVEWAGHGVRIVPGDYENIKITTPEDLELAERILERRKNAGRNRL